MMNSNPNKPANPLCAFVEARLHTLGWTQTAAERTGGLHKGFIGDILRGQKVTVKGSNVTKLAIALDIPASRIAEVMSASPEEIDERSEIAPDPQGARIRPQATIELTDDAATWSIPRGVIPSGPDSRSARLLLVPVASDAMEPDISRTDYVIVDANQTRLASEGIWMLKKGPIQVLRRVIPIERDGQSLVVLRASNQSYQDQVCFPADVEVLGRCVGRLTSF
jgi:hypothetical protein